MSLCDMNSGVPWRQTWVPRKNAGIRALFFLSGFKKNQPQSLDEIQKVLGVSRVFTKSIISSLKVRCDFPSTRNAFRFARENGINGPLVELVSRGMYRITPAGRQVIKLLLKAGHLE
jgi:hypothetical protein